MAPSPSGNDESFRRQEERRYRAHMAAVEKLARELADKTDFSDDESPTDVTINRVTKSNAPSPSPHLPSNGVFPLPTPRRTDSLCSLASTQRDQSFYSSPIPTIETQSESDVIMVSATTSPQVTSESTMGTFNTSPLISFQLPLPASSAFHNRLHAIGNHYNSTLASLGNEFRATLERVQGRCDEAAAEKAPEFASDLNTTAQIWADRLEDDLRARLRSFTEGVKGDLGGWEEVFEKVVRR